MSIEDIPRWWPGLWGGGERVHWLRLNDDDPIHLCDVPNPLARALEKDHLRFQDLVILKDGECWGCMRSGDYRTAKVVRARRIWED